MKNQGTRTRFIVLMGMFVALSVVGGFIKLPNPVTSSIAFDALPAYLAALVLGGAPGAVIGFLGHMASAAVGGFPLTIPIHLFVGVQMAVIMLVFNFVAKKINLVAAIIVGIILNGIAAPACFILIPGQGLAVFTFLLLPLTAASTMNIIVASVIYKSIKNVKFFKEFKGEKNGLQG